MPATNYLPRDRKSFALGTTLDSIARSVIPISFKGYEARGKKRYASSAGAPLTPPLAGHKLERRRKLDCVVQGAIERAAHRVNPVHALDSCSGLFRRR